MSQTEAINPIYETTESVSVYKKRLINNSSEIMSNLRKKEDKLGVFLNILRNKKFYVIKFH